MHNADQSFPIPHYKQFATGHPVREKFATLVQTDGPGIESRLGRDFPHPSRPALRPTQSPVQWAPGLSGGKAAGA